MGTSGLDSRHSRRQAFTALQEQMGGHVGVYAVDSHSCVVDAAMAKLAEPERRPEREGADKRAQLER